jgi:hypothetical protein
MTAVDISPRQLALIETIGGHLQTVISYGGVFMSGVIIGFEASDYPMIWPITQSYTGKAVTYPYTQLLEIGIGILAVCVMMIILLEWVVYLHER